MPIPIIDLFAGPGGLGEGFSSLRGPDGDRFFKIRLSIEMDPHAHQTLQLRAFFRQFPFKQAPDAYYDYLRGNLEKEELFERFPAQYEAAKEEAWNATLGKTDPALVTDRIWKALGQNKRNWLLIGGPPCQAYSLAGRSRMIGEKGRAEFEKDHRHFLYREYLRIIAEHQPAVFVMENVKGLLSAKFEGQGMFSRILDDLRNPFSVFPDLRETSSNPDLSYSLFALAAKPGPDGYAPADFLIRAEEFGIPQARHRVIILGIRDKVRRPPDLLHPIDERVKVRDVIGDLPKLRSGRSDVPRHEDVSEAWKNAILAVQKAPWYESATDELRVTMARNLTRMSRDLKRGEPFVQCKPNLDEPLFQWYVDARLGGVCNHQTRSHLTADLHRYFFTSCFAEQFRTSPLLEHLPKELLPEHKNVAEALQNTKFNDRFRVQLADRPSTTVVSHISKDGHYYIHYDPTQCRSLTVREAARLQTFPDNYFFEGPRTEQYHQVGNAVPPLLAHKIAKIVADLFP